jgi:hypothetical protein
MKNMTDFTANEDFSAPEADDVEDQDTDTEVEQDEDEEVEESEDQDDSDEDSSDDDDDSDDESNDDEDEDSDDEEESKKKPAPGKRLFKYKADDQEFEEELDDEEIGKRLSLAKGAQRRMADAAAAIKKAETTETRAAEIFRGFANNPRIMFEHAGIKGQDYFDWVATEMERYVEESYLTDEERGALDADRQRQEQEAEKARLTEEQNLEKVKGLIMEVSEQVEDEVLDSLNKLNVPKNREVRDRILIDTVKEMIVHHHKCLEEGKDPTLTMEKAMRRALKYRESTTLNHIRNLTPEQLVEYLGQDVTDRVSKEQARRLQAKKVPAPVVGNTTSPNKVKKVEAKKPMTTDDMKRKLRGW